MRYLAEYCKTVNEKELNVISPDDGGQQQLVVVLEGRQDGLTQQQVGEDPASEDDEHGGDPEGERMFPRERQGAVGEVVSHSQAAEGCVGEVEVGEHLELGDLVGQVQEGLGVHDESVCFSLPTCNSQCFRHRRKETGGVVCTVYCTMYCTVHIYTALTVLITHSELTEHQQVTGSLCQSVSVKMTPASYLCPLAMISRLCYIKLSESGQAQCRWKVSPVSSQHPARLLESSGQPGLQVRLETC